MSRHPSAVVLSIDGVGARYLGPYGNTWLRTPSLNRWASEGILFETAYCRSPTEHPQDWGWNQGQLESIPAHCHMTLVTDAPTVGEWGETYFDETLQLEIAPRHGAADDLEETALAQFFSTAIDRLTRLEPGQGLVLHTRGLFQAWDAPYAYREAFRDELDPPAPSEVEFPAQRLDRQADPDLLLGWQQAYAAQIQLLDECLGLFFDQLRQSRPVEQQPLTCLTSSRAFPIGEHGQFGSPETCLYDDALHVPLIVCPPASGQHSIRVQDLVYADHWMDWVIPWLGGEPLPRPAVLPVRHRRLLRSCNNLGDWSIRTAAWKLLMDQQPSKLFVKPDDRWEKNDVASRCPDVVAALEAISRNPDPEACDWSPILEWGVD